MSQDTLPKIEQADFSPSNQSFSDIMVLKRKEHPAVYFYFFV